MAITASPSMFKPRQAPAAVPATPPTIEVIRQRAKHRLIGASVLVLAGVLVFPVLFDTQPRPIPVEIPIEIPSRAAAEPLLNKGGGPVPVEVGTDRSLSPREVLVEAPVESAALAATERNPVAEPSDAVRPSSAVEVRAPEATTQKSTVLSSAPSVSSSAALPSAKEGARAQALLEGRDVRALTANAERFIVQVGAFADPSLAQQARLKLERAGLKTYTHVASTADGKRTRVRLGPFESRTEADKAAAKAKGLGITATILKL